MTTTRVPMVNTVEGDTSWMTSAACLGTDTRMWFADVKKGGLTDVQKAAAAAKVRRAKGICGSCPVVADCLEWAMTTPERYGLWGGLTADERQTLRKRKRRRAAR